LATRSASKARSATSALRESERPIVFVAGATGFAPVKSMVEDAFRRGIKRQIHLYWGVKTAEGSLPARTAATAGRKEHDNFHFIPVLSEARVRKPTGAAAPAWSTKPSSTDFPELKEHEIYACGSVRMVEAIFPFLKAHGAEDGQCFSDAFTLSARSVAFQPRGK
jgi:CDP-4-dehydro-6-deoxyglucose reductase